MASTHISNITGRILAQATPPTSPEPKVGDEFWDSDQHGWFIYSGSNWLGRNWSSTSTSTTTSTSTSTSTSTTSTSTSTTTTTSTSTSTTTTF